MYVKQLRGRPSLRLMSSFEDHFTLLLFSYLTSVISIRSDEAPFKESSQQKVVMIALAVISCDGRESFSQP